MGEPLNESLMFDSRDMLITPVGGETPVQILLDVRSLRHSARIKDYYTPHKQSALQVSTSAGAGIAVRSKIVPVNVFNESFTVAVKYTQSFLPDIRTRGISLTFGEYIALESRRDFLRIKVLEQLYKELYFRANPYYAGRIPSATINNPDTSIFRGVAVCTHLGTALTLMMTGQSNAISKYSDKVQLILESYYRNFGSPGTLNDKELLLFNTISTTYNYIVIAVQEMSVYDVIDVLKSVMVEDPSNITEILTS